MDYAIHAAKTKALISFAVTAKLIYVFDFTYAKSRFSHYEAQMCCYSKQETLCEELAETILCLNIGYFSEY